MPSSIISLHPMAFVATNGLPEAAPYIKQNDMPSLYDGNTIHEES